MIMGKSGAADTDAPPAATGRFATEQSKNSKRNKKRSGTDVPLLLLFILLAFRHCKFITAVVVGILRVTLDPVEVDGVVVA